MGECEATSLFSSFCMLAVGSAATLLFLIVAVRQWVQIQGGFITISVCLC